MELEYSPPISPKASRKNINQTSKHKHNSPENAFSHIPLPNLKWWNPLDWPSLVQSPLTPRPPTDLNIEDLDKFLQWKQYEQTYRTRISREFAKFLIIPTTLINLLVTMRIRKVIRFDLAAVSRSTLWRWSFIFIPFFEELLGDLLLSPFPFLFNFAHDLIGFTAALLPLVRLVSPERLSLHASAWCLYFSFLNSLVMTSGYAETAALPDASVVDFVEFSELASRESTLDLNGLMSRESSVRDFKEFAQTLVSRESSGDLSSAGSRGGSSWDLREAEMKQARREQPQAPSPSFPRTPIGFSIRDRVELCWRAWRRTLDHLKWPTFGFWMVGSLFFGPLITKMMMVATLLKLIIGSPNNLFLLLQLYDKMHQNPF
eukprot:TRINITY_DN14333_c0_g1_i1.p1 TRINITY_DN14333_c0_g1~~TRINITY_DN14333_c0_g1_i1.p1  ORF type:complete len:374 (+),score=36.49 TRINITY_DN14333_c0_g1_i1:112-1233(+)